MKKRFPKKEAISFVVGNRSMREYDKESVDEKVLIPTGGTHIKENQKLLDDLKSVLPSKEAPNLLEGWRGAHFHVPDDVDEALKSSDSEGEGKKAKKNKIPTKFEELDDDFVTQAQSDFIPRDEEEPSDYDESDSEGGYGYDLNDIDEGPTFFDSEGKAVADPSTQKNSLLKYLTRIQDDNSIKPEAKEFRTFLEEKFDLAVKRQEENQDDPEEAVLPEGGGVDIQEFDAILDEFLDDQRQHTKINEWEKLGIEPKEDETSYVDVFRVKKASLKKDPFFSNPDYKPKSEIKDIVKRDLIQQVEDDSYEELSEEEGEHWDCETILSTYTNTENHPALINEPLKEKKQIKLSAKTGLPLGVLPERPSKKPVEMPEAKNHGQSRPRDETATEKKLRKQQIKDEKKKQREMKKKFKTAFTEEQKIQKKIQIANPSISKIRIN